ncbi:MAG TPA: DUF4235 domain-containing protein [Jatrophihabitans sp.]|nr:DUF4235 domain-containing protein [Jatrophihabitans sp.]
MAAGARIGIKLIGVMIGVPVSIASRKLVERAWVMARPDDPPHKPTDEGVRWVDAIAWGALSAVGVVVADLVSRTGAVATYKVITGNEPPPPKPSKSEKKQLKKEEKKASAGQQAAKKG